MFHPFMLPAASRMAFFAGSLFLASLPTFANSVSFDGYQLNSLYGPENLTVTGGNLLVPTTSSDFGGATSLLPAGTSFLTASFLDSGSTSGPAASLWVQDFTSTVTYEAAVGAFTGYSDYVFLYRIDGGSVSVFLSSTIPRTPGAHSAALQRLSNGTLEFFLDNTLVASATASQFGIPVLSDVVLTADGNASGEQATFTSFASAIPEPSCLPCCIGILAAIAFVRKRKPD